MSKFEYIPGVHEDGVDFIRIDARAKTKLGRLLANTAHTPFNHEGTFTRAGLGEFQSLEGFWLYVAGGCADEWLRELHGREASERASCRILRKPRSDFRELILEGLRDKVIQTQQIVDQLWSNQLPFVRVTSTDGPFPTLVTITEQPWFIEDLEKLRMFGGTSKVKPMVQPAHV